MKGQVIPGDFPPQGRGRCRGHMGGERTSRVGLCLVSFTGLSSVGAGASGHVSQAGSFWKGQELQRQEALHVFTFTVKVENIPVAVFPFRNFDLFLNLLYDAITKNKFYLEFRRCFQLSLSRVWVLANSEEAMTIMQRSPRYESPGKKGWIAMETSMKLSMFYKFIPCNFPVGQSTPRKIQVCRYPTFDSVFHGK